MSGLLLPLVICCPKPGLAQANPYRAQMLAAATLRPSSPGPLSTGFTTPGTDGFAARRFNSRAPGAMLMIIGGAGIVAGLLVGGSGGTVLILGGVGVGAYGVYLYTR